MESPIATRSKPVGIGRKNESISSMPMALQKKIGSFMVKSVDNEFLFTEILLRSIKKTFVRIASGSSELKMRISIFSSSLVSMGSFHTFG